MIRVPLQYVIAIAFTIFPALSFTVRLQGGAHNFRQSTSTLQANTRKNDVVTLKELAKELQSHPELFLSNQDKARKSSKSKRTRQKVAVPKQQYVYAAHKRNGTAESNSNSPIVQARAMGLRNPANQHCDAPISTVEPQIMGRIQLINHASSEDVHSTKESSQIYAYIIDKPFGWSIVGSDKKSKGNTERDSVNSNKGIEHPESSDDDDESQDDSDDESKISPSALGDEGNLSFETAEWDIADMLAVMTPEEIADLEAESRKDESLPNISLKMKNSSQKTKIQKSQSQATFEAYSRPSIVNWLKKFKAEEGKPIRGGNFWTAVAGATNVDDTGLVVLCPKDMVENLYIDSAAYIAIVGNGKNIAPKPDVLSDIQSESVEVEVLTKLKRNRGDDIVLTVRVSVTEHFSTCNHVVKICQDKLQDGIRGDPSSNPFDRRAPRRLIHCDALTVSSLGYDDTITLQSPQLPDDIAVLAERRNHHQFVQGSFLGRTELLENPYTTAYREINGDADGFPGWKVDRYDKWLLVQHDDQYSRGPLPSIHDGKTAGVYYLPADPNRSKMGLSEIRPMLLEGKPAPTWLPIQENGVTYLVSLDRDLSTGIFLDQRLQRGWLKRNCNAQTRVLNCFAHCGAFSIAAASAGASTVSLDLNPKFLDRIPRQLEANGIDTSDGRHDTIYGDCFDWIARLAKRGEEFDLIILDPPSTSIGIKKRRWSVQNDMAELVSLAAPMIKKGGLLWTSTNSATLHPIKFAKMCQKGLEDAGLGNAKLERVVPMPNDFLSVGSSPVKNLVWRIQ